MKKSALALAVAAALGVAAAAQADTTLYGSARVSVDWNNPDVGKDFANFFGIDSNNQYWQVFNNASRLGVRGSEDLGSGVSAIYQYEFGVDVTGGSNYFDSNRPRLVGIKSDLGTVSLGTQYTPYYNVVGYTDTFNSSKTFSQDYFLGSTVEGGKTNGITSGATLFGFPTLYQKGVAAVRKGFNVIYTTPTWNGLSAQGLVDMNGLSGPNSVDSWEWNVVYNNGPWFVGGTMLQAKDQEYANSETSSVTRHSDNQYGAVLGFDNKQFSAAFSWQMYDPERKSEPFCTTATVLCPSSDLQFAREKVSAYTGQLSYTFGNEVLRATFSYLNPNDIEVKTYIGELGFQHNLSKRTRLWVEGAYASEKLSNAKIPNNTVGLKNSDIKDANASFVSVGIRHDF